MTGIYAQIAGSFFLVVGQRFCVAVLNSFRFATLCDVFYGSLGIEVKHAIDYPLRHELTVSFHLH